MDAAMTEPVVHDWAFSLGKGKRGEIRVAQYLESAGYVAIPCGYVDGGTVSMTAPDMRVISHATNPSKYLVGKTLEVKTDSRAHETGNVVIELLSNACSGRLGWIYSCESDALAYLVEDTGEAIFVETRKMQAAMSVWRGRFVGIENSTFFGLSMLVPLDSLRSLAFHVAVIP